MRAGRSVHRQVFAVDERKVDRFRPRPAAVGRAVDQRLVIRVGLVVERERREVRRPVGRKADVRVPHETRQLHLQSGCPALAGVARRIDDRMAGSVAPIEDHCTGEEPPRIRRARRHADLVVQSFGVPTAHAHVPFDADQRDLAGGRTRGRGGGEERRDESQE